MSFQYMPFYTGDYLRDTRHLTPMKHGVYVLLLFYCWDQKGPLPLDEQECAGIANCRSADEVDALRYVLERFFVKFEDGYYNKRIEDEIAKAEFKSKNLSENGKKGAEARKKTQKIKQLKSNAKQMPSKCQAIDEHLPVDLDLRPRPYTNPIPTPKSDSGESLTTDGKFHTTKTPLPHNYGISDEIKTWAAMKGYAADLDKYLEAFKLKVEANGYQKSNWDAFFKTSMLEDWGKVREKKQSLNEGKTALQIFEEREAERAKNGL